MAASGENMTTVRGPSICMKIVPPLSKSSLWAVRQWPNQVESPSWGINSCPVRLAVRAPKAS